MTRVPHLSFHFNPFEIVPIDITSLLIDVALANWSIDPLSPIDTAIYIYPPLSFRIKGATDDCRALITQSMRTVGINCWRL